MKRTVSMSISVGKSETSPHPSWAQARVENGTLILPLDLAEHIAGQLEDEDAEALRELLGKD